MDAHYFEDPEDFERFLGDLRTGEISLKWAYAGSAALTHDALGKSEGYNANSDASSLEAQLISERLDHANSVADIGPGNSMHTEALWRRVAPEKRPNRYLLLDFSRDLMALCKSRIESPNAALANSSISVAVWDFELGPTSEIERWRGQSSILAMLIGHTIGNPAHPIEVIQNIYNSLRWGDELVLSLSLRSDDRMAISSYADSQVFRIAATEPFRMAGLDVMPDDLELRIDEDGSVIGAVLLESSRPLGVPHKVTCFRSRRFSEARAIDMVEAAGFSIANIATGGGHVAILGSK